jgi:hypothetical protein
MEKKMTTGSWNRISRIDYEHTIEGAVAFLTPSKPVDEGASQYI